MSYKDSVDKLFNWIKEKFGAGNKKKLVENIIIVIIIGIIIIIAGGAFFKKQPVPAAAEKSVNEAGEVSKTVKVNQGETAGEAETLSDILSKIEGAGRVDVMITYSSSEEIVPAYDRKNNESDTTEKDSSGGTRSVNSKDTEESVVYQQDQEGAKQPVIIKNIKPEVRGVVVVAEGAGDAEVKEKLSTAVRTLMGVPAHKVQVFERKK